MESAHVFLWGCLASFTYYNHLRSIHVICINSNCSLLSSSIPQNDYISLLIHLPVDENLDCFQIWAIRNKAAISIHVQLLLFSWINT